MTIIAQRGFDPLNHLRQQVGTQDLKIACISLAHDGTFLTRNVADFKPVPELRVEVGWIERLKHWVPEQSTTRQICFCSNSSAMMLIRDSHPPPLLERSSVFRIPIPIYHFSDDRDCMMLAGTGFLLDVASTTFLITAAHVCETVCREGILLPGEKAFHSYTLRWYRTVGTDGRLGTRNDITDIAIAELPTEFREQLGSSRTIVGLNWLEYDRIVPMPEPMVIMGFPLSRNKISRTTRHVNESLSVQQGMHVAPNDNAFQNLFVGDNLVIRLSVGQLVRFPHGPRGGPHPKGMSGGPILSVDGSSFIMRREIRFRGIIGLAFEYDELHRCVFGIHINLVLRMLSEGWPHLSLILPDLENTFFKSSFDA